VNGSRDATFLLRFVRAMSCDAVRLPYDAPGMSFVVSVADHDPCHNTMSAYAPTGSNSDVGRGSEQYGHG
jgi:hypothetical protein